MRGFRLTSGARLPAVTVLTALVLMTAPTLAQAQAPRPDFLFRAPRASFGARFGYSVALASSEVFDFSREQLTLDRADFDATAWGVDLGIRVTRRVDVTLGLAYAKASAPSEMRGWVGEDDLPIEQVTEFSRVPVTVGIKAYLWDRGRSIGQFAWVPRAMTPYVGAATGWVWYHFEQDGDFVDFETLDIFTDNFTEDGHAPTVHLFGGADWSLGPAFFLTTEGRYQWARADMRGKFVGFDAIDLSGFQATVGISARF